MANEEALAVHERTTWTDHVKFDYDAERSELLKLEDALNAAAGSDYDGLLIDMRKLDDEFMRHLTGYLNIDYFQARSLMERLMRGFAAAVYKTDWRRGYGKVRNDATVPEAAAKLAINAIELLTCAFAEEGVRTYRNRHHDFLEGMAEFASQTLGSPAGNGPFYETLGKRVAREVLDHQLVGPRPLLAPTGSEYVQIETAALEQVVYFIQVGEAGAIKIGIAGNPEARLSNLQTGHHEELQIRALTAGGAEREKEYHARFAEHRLRGEWFAPHEDILAEITRLSASCVEGRK